MIKQLVQKIATAGALVAVATVVFTSSASAHVVVKPSEVVTAGFQTFSIGVPNEKDIATTSVKLVIPDGLMYVQPIQKAGWTITVNKEGSGDAVVVKSITWSGNQVKAGFRDEFTFSGKVPDTATELQWKAYQTYSDGTVVSWDKAGQGEESESETSGPFSVTKVVYETTSDVAINAASKAATNAQDTAKTALYTAISALVIGLISILLVAIKKK